MKTPQINALPGMYPLGVKPPKRICASICPACGGDLRHMTINHSIQLFNRRLRNRFKMATIERHYEKLIDGYTKRRFVMLENGAREIVATAMEGLRPYTRDI